MLSSTQRVLFKLSKTTSPQKLFPSDCITLYCSKDCETSSADVFFMIYYWGWGDTPDPGVIQDLMVIYKSIEPYWSPSVLDRVAGPNFDALLLLRHLKFTHLK